MSIPTLTPASRGRSYFHSTPGRIGLENWTDFFSDANTIDKECVDTLAPSNILPQLSDADDHVPLKLATASPVVVRTSTAPSLRPFVGNGVVSYYRSVATTPERVTFSVHRSALPNAHVMPRACRCTCSGLFQLL
eukprot:m.1638194 g.1638194  ORF g.1638194 m.1638194 type:complete len:135 (+) comp27211_c0_seq1:783-1187(+)